MGRQRASPDVNLILVATCVLVFVLLIVYPLLMLTYGSLGRAQLTLRYYLEAVTTPKLIETFANTLVVTVGSTAIASAFGILYALVTSRTNIPHVATIETLMIFPFFVSPLIGAMAWNFVLGPMGLVNYLSSTIFGLEKIVDSYNLVAISWVMGLYFAPFVFLFTSSGLKSMNPALEEASAMAGAGSLRTLLGVTLPVVAPSVLSGILLVFVSAASHFSVPLLLGRHKGIYTITTRIFDLMSGYPARFELAAALSILLLSITAIGMYLQRRQIRGREFVTVTGRGFRPRLIDLGKWRHPVFFLCLFYLAIAFALPLIMLVLSSFTPYFDLRNLQLTTSNWQFILFQHPMTARGIKNSFLLALLTATATTFLALIVSFLVVRTKVVGRSILDYLSMMPVGIPITGFAVALLYAWIQAPIPIYGTIWILFVAYMTMEIPYGMRASSSALRQIDEELEGASRMCGGSWLHTMRKIVLPLMKPGLMAGWVMIFVSSFRESTASILLQSYGNEVFSIVLYERWVEGGFTECSALAALQVIFIFAVILISRKVVGFEIGKIV